MPDLNDILNMNDEELMKLAKDNNIVQTGEILERTPVEIALENIITNLGFLRMSGFVEETDKIIDILEKMIREKNE